MLTREDAESLLRRMVDAALTVVDSKGSPAQLTDEQYTELRRRLEEGTASAINIAIGVQG